MIRPATPALVRAFLPIADRERSPPHLSYPPTMSLASLAMGVLDVPSNRSSIMSSGIPEDEPSSLISSRNAFTLLVIVCGLRSPE